MSFTAAQLQPVYNSGLTAAANLGSLFMRKGVNMSGAEFGTFPGTLNVDYTFPTTTELAYYYGKGMHITRIPFVWDRIQPVLGGPLDSGHISWLTSLAQFNSDMTILLDVHNYGAYGNGFIGLSGGPTSVQFADLWSKLATVFKSNLNVRFGLMNEPHAQTPSQWLTIVNDAIAAIRATGATNVITVPGLGYDSGWGFINNGSAAALINVVDSGSNFVYEVHGYFDFDNSGQSATAFSGTVGSDRLKDVTNWARLNQKRLLLGEFGAANNTLMLAALTDCVSFMRANADVWDGWTYWSGGPWWGSYMYSIEPDANGDKPQMITLLPHLN